MRRSLREVPYEINEKPHDAGASWNRETRMTTIQYHLTKAGPRLLDVMVDSPQIDCTVTGPGMLIQALKLLTDRDALSGCDAEFYDSVAKDLDATYFCGHRPPSAMDVSVEPHRLGAELTIDVGPVSMYQTLIRLRTLSGRTFRQLLMESIAGEAPEQMIAVLYAVRATSHHEHHASAAAAIREHASGHGERGMRGGDGH